MNRTTPRPRRFLLPLALGALVVAGFVPSALRGDDGPSEPGHTAVERTSTAMGIADARHLLARTGFGGTIEEIRATAALSRTTAVDRILAEVRTESLLPPPAFLDLPRSERTLPRGASREERQAFQRVRRQHGQQLRSWWVGEMSLTDSPLTETLTLFWHDHFVSEMRKVRSPELMWRQNTLLRQHAAGSFRTLLREISIDPAMVIYLDSQQNRRGAPNENYARELYELFTLGEGHYSEADIRETARALTGYRVNRLTGTTNFVRRFHDDGEKTIFGETGRHGLDEVIDLVLARPRTATFIVEELWRAFVSPDLDAAEITRLAQLLRDGDYELAPLLRAMFLCDAFWAETNRGALFRSPVDLVVGTARLLGPESIPPASLQRAIAGMGQNLFDPPNVKGWPGADRWITSDSLLQRRQFLDRALLGRFIAAGRERRMRGGSSDREEPSMDEAMDPGIVVDPESEEMTPDRRTRPDQRRMRRTPPSAMESLRDGWLALGTSNAERSEALEHCLCPLPAVNERPSGERPGQTLQRLLLDPTYQLK